MSKQSEKGSSRTSARRSEKKSVADRLVEIVKDLDRSGYKNPALPPRDPSSTSAKPLPGTKPAEA